MYRFLILALCGGIAAEALPLLDVPVALGHEYVQPFDDANYLRLAGLPQYAGQVSAIPQMISASVFVDLIDMPTTLRTPYLPSNFYDRYRFNVYLTSLDGQYRYDFHSGWSDPDPLSTTLNSMPGCVMGSGDDALKFACVATDVGLEDYDPASPRMNAFLGPGGGVVLHVVPLDTDATVRWVNLSVAGAGTLSLGSSMNALGPGTDPPLPTPEPSTMLLTGLLACTFATWKARCRCHPIARCGSRRRDPALPVS